MELALAHLSGGSQEMAVIRVIKVTLRLGQREIEPVRLDKYLLIWLDDNLSFGIYIQKAKENAERCLAAY